MISTYGFGSFAIVVLGWGGAVQEGYGGLDIVRGTLVIVQVKKDLVAWL